MINKIHLFIFLFHYSSVSFFLENYYSDIDPYGWTLNFFVTPKGFPREIAIHFYNFIQSNEFFHIGYNPGEKLDVEMNCD